MPESTIGVGIIGVSPVWDIAIEGTGEQIMKTAPDQIAVIGTPISGAIASIHVREAAAGGTGFVWEINGTDGTLRDRKVRGLRGACEGVADWALCQRIEAEPFLCRHPPAGGAPCTSNADQVAGKQEDDDVR